MSTGTVKFEKTIIRPTKFYTQISDELANSGELVKDTASIIEAPMYVGEVVPAAADSHTIIRSYEVYIDTTTGTDTPSYTSSQLTATSDDDDVVITVDGDNEVTIDLTTGDNLVEKINAATGNFKAEVVGTTTVVSSTNGKMITVTNQGFVADVSADKKTVERLARISTDTGETDTAKYDLRYNSANTGEITQSGDPAMYNTTLDNFTLSLENIGGTADFRIVYVCEIKS